MVERADRRYRSVAVRPSCQVNEPEVRCSYQELPSTIYIHIASSRHPSMTSFKHPNKNVIFSHVFRSALMEFHHIENWRVGGESAHNSSSFRIPHFLAQ